MCKEDNVNLRIIALLLYSFFVAGAMADSNKTTQTFQEYIDEKQKVISGEVINLFDSIDRGISSLVGGTSTQAYCDDMEKKAVNEFFEEQNSIDEFFKNNKYTDETQKSYLRVSLGSAFESKKSVKFIHKVRAQVPLSKTKESFKLFIDDVQDNYYENSIESKDKQKSIEVGVNYFAPTPNNIKSKYSIGFSGFSPFLSARYSKDFKMQRWLIQPTQQFKYSTKSDFSEETNIYFDRTLEELSLFRTTLHRKTQSSVAGFDYALAFSYYLTPSKKKGFSFTQQFWGNSRYTCDVAPQPYGGISDYSTFISWRQNIFRKWIAYEIQPGVSFHRQYDYKPNQIVRFYVDFYFGNI